MINIYDRIKERTYTIGTGNFALSGVVHGFSSFSSVYSNNDELFYAITDGTSYEIGSGVYLSAGNQIKRFPIKSTNSNGLVNFPEGLKEIYVNYPATNAVFSTSGLYSVPQNSGLAFWSSSNALSYSSKLIIDSGNGRIGINKSNPTTSIDVGGPSLSSNIRASGFIVGNSGVFFPSGNNGSSSYLGGTQLTHFEMNQTDINSASVIQLSGSVNQNILFKKQNAGTVFAGPPSGCSPPCSPAYPVFRPLTVEDMPDLSSLFSPEIHSNFRISTSPTDPLAEGDTNTIYLHPYIGNMISLFDGSKWKSKQFSSTLALSASSVSADVNYDIYVYLNNNDGLSFEYSARNNNEPISIQDTVYCKYNDKTRRYIGSVRKLGSSFRNNVNNRLVFNAYNRVKRLSQSYASPNYISLTPSNNFTIVNTSILTPFKFLYGLPEFIDAHASLLIELPGYDTSSYQLILLDKFYSEEAKLNNNILTSREIIYDLGEVIVTVNTVGQGFYLYSDYGPLNKTVATASMTTKLDGYLELMAAHRVPSGVSPTISTWADYGAVGYNAISYQ